MGKLGLFACYMYEFDCLCQPVYLFIPNVDKLGSFASDMYEFDCLCQSIYLFIPDVDNLFIYLFVYLMKMWKKLVCVGETGAICILHV